MRGKRRWPILESFLLAIILTGLNAAKDLCVDDTVYYYYAQHLAQDPLNPYGFRLSWHQIPDTAQNPIAPPFIPYWWALGLKMFGDSQFWWKAWFFPVNLLLVLATRALLRRFAPRLARPLLYCTLLSPCILPSINLMLDVPLLAFYLTSLALFLRAGDRGSWLDTLSAGLFLGLAMLTKWTAVVGVGTLFCASISLGRLRHWFVAVALALALFIAWESYVARTNGESHFLHQIKINNPTREDKKSLVLPLIMLVGGAAPYLALVGGVALGLSRRVLYPLMAAFVLGFACLPFDPGGRVGTYLNPITGRPWVFRLDTPILLTFGMITWGIMLAVVLGILLQFKGGYGALRRRRPRSELFLLAWFLLELAGYFVLSPFPAIRRVINLIFVMTLIAGAWASRRLRHTPRAEVARVMLPIAALGVVLGLVYCGVDMAEARSARAAAERSAAWIRARDGGAIIWFSGFHGFEYYAHRAGLRPMCPGSSHLRPGQWLIIQQRAESEWGYRYELDEARLHLEHVLEVGDRIPLTTSPMYIGRRPIEGYHGPRWLVKIYRVVEDYAPERKDH